MDSLGKLTKHFGCKNAAFIICWYPSLFIYLFIYASIYPSICSFIFYLFIRSFIYLLAIVFSHEASKHEARRNKGSREAAVSAQHQHQSSVGHRAWWCAVQLPRSCSSAASDKPTVKSEMPVMNMRIVTGRYIRSTVCLFTIFLIATYCTFNKLTMVCRCVDSYLPRFTSSHGQNVERHILSMWWRK